MISTATYVAICLAFAAAIPYLNDKPSGSEKPAASEKPLYNVEIDDEIYLQPEGTVSFKSQPCLICLNLVFLHILSLTITNSNYFSEKL